MRQLSYILCLIELALMVLVSVVAWLASVLGCDIANPVSEEGFRWLFNHGATALVSLQLAYLILLLSAIGSVQESGILSDFLKKNQSVVLPQESTSLSQKDAASHLQNEAKQRRKALYVSMSFFIIVVLCLVLPIFIPHSALLGVTGGIIPSPWLMGFPMALLLSIVITSLIYSGMCGKLGGILGIPHYFSVGITKYGSWIVVGMLGTLLVRFVKFIVLTS